MRSIKVNFSCRRIGNCFLLLFIIAVANVDANLFSQSKIDGLKAKLVNLSGIEKIEMLNELAKAYVKSSYDDSKRYANQALELARQLNYKTGEANSLRTLGLCCCNHGKYDEALEYSIRALKIYEKIGDHKRIISTVNDLRFIYQGIESSSQIRSRNYLIIGALFALAFIILILLAYYQIKKKNKLLAGHEQHYRSVIEQSNECIFLVAMDSRRILEVNPAFLKLIGYSRDEILQMTLYDFLDHEKEDVNDKIQSILEHSKASLGERRYRRKDGTIVDVEVRAYLIHSAGKAYMYVVAMDITERKKAEKKIRASLEEKEVLLKEIHHRVKNNMQIISSLISLQTEMINDPKIQDLFLESQRRIESMALIHEMLYQSKDFAGINVPDFVNELTSNLFSNYSLMMAKDIRLKLNIDDIKLGIDKILPCGLVLNELISNSLKHAFPGGRKGEIRISFSRRENENKYRLLVKDNGIGLPKNFDYRKADSLGMLLVYNLVRQLKGNLKVTAERGTQFEITFNI
jgi:PAS domain S-box-containing protein